MAGPPRTRKAFHPHTFSRQCKAALRRGSRARTGSGFSPGTHGPSRCLRCPKTPLGAWQTRPELQRYQKGGRNRQTNARIDANRHKAAGNLTRKGFDARSQSSIPCRAQTSSVPPEAGTIVHSLSCSTADGTVPCLQTETRRNDGVPPRSNRSGGASARSTHSELAPCGSRHGA
jgi:hypothetical protein